MGAQQGEDVMKFAIFRCCATSVYLQQYESSTDAVMKKLGVELVDVPEFNCCGNPLKSYDFKAYLLSAVRNLSIAEKKGLDMVTLCNCCYGSLKQADHLMKEDPSIRNEINGKLQSEGLTYNGGIKVRHVLDVLSADIGIDRIKQKLVKSLNGPKMAVQYGCHILRPREITEFDHPETPTKLDQMVELTGAKSIDWSAKLKCCGAPSLGVNDDLSMDLAENKLNDAKQSGADFLCVVCVFCQLQFDRVQRMLCEERKKTDPIPSILYTQLLGLGLGIEPAVLGIDRNELTAGGLLGFLESAS